MPTDLTQVLSPIEAANGLPNENYVSDAVFAEERQRVLFDNWSGVGFGKDIPKAGDANPIEFLGMPLLAVRDQEGGIRVYQNTCRHRGMILVDRPKRVGGVIVSFLVLFAEGRFGRIAACGRAGNEYT